MQINEQKLSIHIKIDFCYNIWVFEQINGFKEEEEKPINGVKRFKAN